MYNLLPSSLGIHDLHTVLASQTLGRGLKLRQGSGTPHPLPDLNRKIMKVLRCKKVFREWCNHCGWDGKVFWQLGAKEYHKVTVSLSAFNPASGKGFLSVTVLPTRIRVSLVKLLQL